MTLIHARLGDAHAEMNEDSQWDGDRELSRRLNAATAKARGEYRPWMGAITAHLAKRLPQIVESLEILSVSHPPIDRTKIY